MMLNGGGDDVAPIGIPGRPCHTLSARLFASVPPDVNIISRDERAPIAAATVSRA